MNFITLTMTTINLKMHRMIITPPQLSPSIPFPGSLDTNYTPTHKTGCKIKT